MKLRSFTVLELLVVLAIISVLVATTAPSATRLFQDFRLTRRAGEVAAYFHLARQYAVTEQTTYGLYIYQSQNKFKMVRRVEDPDNPGEYIDEERGSFTVESPLTITLSSYEDGELVTFNSVGNPSESGSLVLADSRNRKRTVCINPVGSIELVVGSSCD